MSSVSNARTKTLTGTSRAEPVMRRAGRVSELARRATVLLTVVLLGLSQTACNEPQAAAAPRPVSVELLTLAPSEVRDTSEYLGNVVSRQNVSILPQVGGAIRQILVSPGETVKTGQVLIQVDARQETADLESARARQQSAQANMELARQSVERAAMLHAEGLATTQELEQAQAEAKAAEAAFHASKADVTGRQVQLQFHAVRAPFSGKLGDILVKVGSYVSPTTPLTTLTQSQALEVHVTVPPKRARAIGPDTRLELLDAEGEVALTAPIHFVAPDADPRTQLVDVIAVFDNSIDIRPSELVRTRIVYGSRQAVQVPALSVVRQSGQAFVFALESGEQGSIVRRKPVQLGDLGEHSYPVIKGLVAGDQIAVSSLQALRDGALVTPKPSPAAAASAPADTLQR